MNPETLRQTYRELTEMLRDLGLGWVVHQVDETINDGSQVEKTANIFKDEDPEELIQVGSPEDRYAPRRRGKAAQMMSVEPWTDTQRLEILIDAIRHALVYAAEIEEAASLQMQEFGEVKINAIRFESEQLPANGKTLTLSPARRELIDRLKSLLISLEAEARG
jgi:hypothetical protein